MSDQHPMVQKIKFERTFCMIKPDGVKRAVVGDVIHRFEKVGLKIVGIKMFTPTEEQVRAHYPMSDDAWIARLGEKSLSGFENIEYEAKDVLGTDDKAEIGQAVADGLVSFMTSGPVVAMVIEGVQAIDMVRKLCGNTLPFKADVGTIRGDYSVDSPSVANAEMRAIHNIVHASENADEATNEIKLWFGAEDVPSYKLSAEDVMYSRYY